MLWENFIVSERMKKQTYQPIYSNNYFWRTYDRQEIDWIEERDGKLYAFEFKWKDKGKKEPVAWRKAYPDSDFQVISRDNFHEFVLIS